MRGKQTNRVCTSSMGVKLTYVDFGRRWEAVADWLLRERHRFTRENMLNYQPVAVTSYRGLDTELGSQCGLIMSPAHTGQQEAPEYAPKPTDFFLVIKD